MTKEETPKAEIAHKWWIANIWPRETKSRARALGARLRRSGDGARILCEPEVHDLIRDLRFTHYNSAHVTRLATLLAEVREDDGRPLARILGGSEPILSRSRFQRLIRADEDAIIDCIRKAIVVAGRRCNVKQLAGDILYWNDRTKARWCFDYFGSVHNKSASDNSSTTEG